MPYTEQYSKAFNYILNKLFQFPTICAKDWVSRFETRAKAGDFVSLQSAPPTEWQFSWIEETDGNDRHLLKSAMTGKLCTWSNVGFSILKPERIDPQFKWTNRQFDFAHKFDLSIKRNYDYWTVFGGIEFDNFKVSCFLRRRHDFSENPFRACMTCDDFRQVKARDLNRFYLSASKENK